MAILLMQGVSAFAQEEEKSVCFNDAGGKWEVSINAVDYWIGSDREFKDHADYLEYIKTGVFDVLAYHFGADGCLKVTEYRGTFTDMKKTEKQYQYKFTDNFLELTADGNTEKLIYELKYHSLGGKSLEMLVGGKKIHLDIADKTNKELIDNLEYATKEFSMR